MIEVKLYEVGGSIRDEFLGLENKDRDYVAVCPKGWAGLKEWAECNLDRVFLESPEFFTIRGIKGKDIIDVVLARKDGAYTDGRHPDTVEPGTLEDDLARRDFTMNAIARSVDTGELFDPFNGREAIEKRIISCVGSTRQRISEDPLRIIRAIRFSITKGMTPDEALEDVLRHNFFQLWIVKLGSVSRERIREELNKMFRFDAVKAAQYLFNDKFVSPEILHAIFGEDIWLKPTMENK